jgi:hypothetical protein
MFSQYEFFPLATRTFVKCSTAECRIGAVAIRLGRKPAVPVVIVSLIFAAESDLPARPVQWVRCRRVCSLSLCSPRAACSSKWRIRDFDARLSRFVKGDTI